MSEFNNCNPAEIGCPYGRGEDFSSCGIGGPQTGCMVSTPAQPTQKITIRSGGSNSSIFLVLVLLIAIFGVYLSFSKINQD